MEIELSISVSLRLTQILIPYLINKPISVPKIQKCSINTLTL